MHWQYLVAWKGYAAHERTWEWASELGGAQKAIDEFEQRERDNAAAGDTTQASRRRTCDSNNNNNNNSNNNNNNNSNSNSNSNSNKHQHNRGSIDAT